MYTIDTPFALFCLLCLFMMFYVCLFFESFLFTLPGQDGFVSVMFWHFWPVAARATVCRMRSGLLQAQTSFLYHFKTCHWHIDAHDCALQLHCGNLQFGSNWHVHQGAWRHSSPLIYTVYIYIIISKPCKPVRFSCFGLVWIHQWGPCHPPCLKSSLALKPWAAWSVTVVSWEAPVCACHWEA